MTTTSFGTRAWARIIGALAVPVLIIAGSQVAATETASAYGPNPPCTITVNVSSTIAGGVVRVSGHAGILGDSLVFIFHSVPQEVARATAGPGGAFNLQITTPANAQPGLHFIQVRDLTSTPTCPTNITINPGGTGPSGSSSGAAGSSSSGNAGSGASGSSGSSGPLAFTGLDAGLLLALAAAAVGLGGMLVLSSRKRQRRDVSA